MTITPQLLLEAAAACLVLAAALIFVLSSLCGQVDPAQCDDNTAGQWTSSHTDHIGDN